jgi:hypothetical protein
VFVEGQIGDQAFEPTVFFFERAELAQLRDAEVRVLLLPDVEGGFAHAQLPTDVGRWTPALDLAERVGDLLPR